MYLMNLIETNQIDISALCVKHNVKSLFVFGSVLTAQFNKNSDVDFIVDFNQINVLDYGDNYFSLKYALEKTLNRNVDLLEHKALKNPYFLKTLNKSKKQIYG